LINAKHGKVRMARLFIVKELSMDADMEDGYVAVI